MQTALDKHIGISIFIYMDEALEARQVDWNVTQGFALFP
jgi:hypothetical protein